MTDQSPIDIVTASGPQTQVLERLNAMAQAMQTHKDTDYFERCLERQDKGEITIFMARAGDQDAGYALLNRKPKYALFKKYAIPEIQDLNVLPAHRRRGIGGALIRACEDTARQERYTRMGIGVGLHAGYGPAQRLYVKAGYIPDGTGVSYDRIQTAGGELRPLDDCLCLMMIKDLV